jgi:hypothetical protein
MARVVVSYHARDIYEIPEEKWREAMALCGNDEDGAFDLLVEEGETEAFLQKSDVTDRYVDATQE